ncbi:MAG: YfhO family protein [Gemmataceae bacterium]|nr:YfhO family protein [Gemmataceae bacterium]MDW8265997.1 YfhO family protein [Gemmataceae bacterium]
MAASASHPAWGATTVCRLRPYLLLAVFASLFFFDLLIRPGGTLYSDTSDLLALHLPFKRFLVSAYRETGELPLWCPHSYAGLPVVHDIQTATFYPPHLVLYLLSEDWVGPAMSWLVWAHLVVAGWAMHAYARSQGLGGAGAFVAAAGFMFAGRWLMHLLLGGHYILAPLAWLPLVLLGLERAQEAGSLPRWLVPATLAGTAYALVILGTHPQLTFYAGLFAGVWTVVPALERAGWYGGPRSGRRTAWALARWFITGTWALAIAVGLSAIQLMPALEAAPLSSRSLGVATWDDILLAGPRVLLYLVGPALTVEPVNLQWEDRGGLAVLWLTAALLAPLLDGPRVRAQAWVTLLFVLFALGGAILVHWLPGFRLFRQPARMMIVVGLPVALLAGRTVQAVGNGVTTGQLSLCRHGLARVVIAAGILNGGFALRLFLQGAPIRWHPYWASLVLTIPAAYVLFSPRAEGWRRRALPMVLLVDLLALTWPAVQVYPEAEVLAPTEIVSFLQRLPPAQRGRVLDFHPLGHDYNSPLGTGAHLALRYRLEPVRGYNSFDILAYKEYLAAIAGHTGPLRPFESDLTFPDVGNVPVVRKPLLDQLGVRYLVQPESEPAPSDCRKVFEERSPAAYDFSRGGRQPLPPYVVYENLTALPRAFVVADLGPAAGGPAALPLLPRHAVIRRDRPNEVVIDVPRGQPGWLVLSDPWYPGWTVSVNGEPRSLLRVCQAFRAVALSSEAQEVVFRFAPQSLRLGRLISQGTGAAVMLLLIGGLVFRRRETS